MLELIHDYSDRLFAVLCLPSCDVGRSVDCEDLKEVQFVSNDNEKDDALHVDVPTSLFVLSAKVTYLTVVKEAWLKWTLLVTCTFVLFGLVSALLLGRPLMSPVGVSGLDVLFYVAVLLLMVGLMVVMFGLLWFPVLLIGGILLALTGVGLFVFQVYVFLRHGEWQSFSLRTLLEIIGFDMTELDHPRDWVGLKRIVKFALEWIPSALFLVIGGGWFTGQMMDAYDESIAKLQKDYRKLSQRSPAVE